MVTPDRGQGKNERDLRKTIFTLLLLHPLMERSHEKGAYLGEIKSKMRGSGLGLGNGDDHGQNRQGRGEAGREDSEAGRRCLGWLDMGGILIWV